MKYRYAVLMLAVALVGSTGCSRYCFNNTDKGALGGAAAGALTGAIIAATSSVHTGPGMGIGALIGGVVGAVVGGHMDPCDLQERLDAMTIERDRLLAELKACRDENAALKAEIARLNARISELESQLASRGPATKELARYVIGNSVLFASGKATLTATGKSILDNTAAEIREKYPTNSVVIEGHTDSARISRSTWKSNWELGAGRALSVLHYFEDNSNIPGQRLSATTYSYFKPVASNDSSDGMAQNRRTEIVVYAD